MCAESRPGGAARGNYSNESNDQYDIWVYWLSEVLLHSYCSAVVRPLPGGRMACGHGRARDGARGMERVGWCAWDGARGMVRVGLGRLRWDAWQDVRPPWERRPWKRAAECQPPLGQGGLEAGGLAAARAADGRLFDQGEPRSFVVQRDDAPGGGAGVIVVGAGAAGRDGRRPWRCCAGSSGQRA